MIKKLFIIFIMLNFFNLFVLAGDLRYDDTILFKISDVTSDNDEQDSMRYNNNKDDSSIKNNDNRKLTGISLPSQNDIILGLSDFIIERAKVELLYGFYTEMGNIMKGTEDIQKLFPNSYTLIKNIDVNTVKNILSIFQKTIIKDLINLPLNIMINYCDDKEKKELYITIYSVIYNIQNGTSPVVAFARFYDMSADFKYAEKNCNNKDVYEVKKSLIILGLFSREFVFSGEYNNGGYPSLNNAFEDNKAIFEKEILKKLKFIDEDEKKIIKKHFKNIKIDYVLEIFIEIDKDYINMKKNIEKIKLDLKSKDNTKNIEIYRQLYIDFIKRIPTYLEKSLKAFGPYFLKSKNSIVFTIITDSIEISEAILQGDYSLAVVNSMNLIKEYIENLQIDFVFKNYNYEDINGCQYKRFVRIADKFFKDNENNTYESGDDILKRIYNKSGENSYILDKDILHENEYLKKCFQYIVEKDKKNIRKNIEKVIGFIGLAANIAKAKTTNDISKAIKDFALPEGAFLLKRKQEKILYLTLNAYLGPAVGMEFDLFKYYQYKNNEIEDKNIQYFKLSPCFTPIGIEIGWNLQNPVLTNIGLFLSILDLGNIIAWRLINPVTASLPEVGFSQIISPGLFVVMGFSRIPITLIGGAFYNPINMDLIYNTTRWHILSVVFSISVDITIFKIY